MRHRLILIFAILLLVFPAAWASAQHSGHGGGGHGSGGWHGGGGHSHGGVYIGGYWGSPYWGWGWGYPYYGYPYAGAYGYGYGYGYGDAMRYGEWGAVKTDVEPEEARVYLDGQYIGTADDFDGWPDKLYLQPGNYKLEFHLNGYQPLTLDIRSRPGATLEVDNRMVKLTGPVSQPADPPTLEGDVPRFYGKRREGDRARPYGGDQYDRNYAPNPNDHNYEPNRGQYAPEEPDREAQSAPPPPRSDDSWRSQPKHDSTTVTVHPARTDRARLTIKAEPADAAVYVDDRFVGTADELASMDRGIVVSPGKHSVTVSRPGYRDRTADVDVATGHSETVTLTLQK